jgi:serine/threonine protein kinase
MAACLAAGDHPKLTTALGRVVDHPEGAQALLLPLLPQHWRPLADPPSLESCSRDVYDPHLRLTAEAATRLARGIAGAVAHLHARGLMHGDLYAHNILWDGARGEARLGDFGAACALSSDEESDDWRRIETRAFGVFLTETLDRCETEIERLREISQMCLARNPRARPLMSEVAQLI